MTPPDPTPAMEFDCPLCAGAFEADLAMLGQEVECPHCGQVVELPDQASIEQEAAASGSALAEEPQQAAPTELPPSVEPVAPSEPRAAGSGAEPEKLQPRVLSREERAAARRRFNLILAAAGAVILVLTFVLLVNLA